MNAQQRWHEVISQNLASSSVPGFKRQDVSFATVQAGLKADAPLMPSTRVSTIFQQGQLRPTGVPTDLALDGNGFFEVQLPHGELAYTRDGEFRVDNTGQLVTKQGHVVQGDGGPIQLNPDNPAPLSVASDGTVSQGAELKGKLKVVGFDNPDLLTALGNGLFAARHAELIPNTTTSASLRQGFLEASNTSPVAEMARLIVAMRMYEANQRVIQSQDERMGRAISEIGSPA